MLELYTKINKQPTEAKFTSAWLKGLKEKKFWTFKISDGGIGLKPFDGIIQSNLNTYFFEAKRITGDTFNFSNIRVNQRTSFHKISNIVNNCEIYETDPKDLKKKNCLLVIFKKDTPDYIIIPFVEVAYLGQNGSIKINFNNKTFISQ